METSKLPTAFFILTLFIMTKRVYSSVILLIWNFILITACQNADIKQGNESKGETHQTTVFCLDQPPYIGEFEGIRIYEGGVSGMVYIPGSDMEFYLINDRGPNMIMNNHALADGQNVKLFPFPDYSPKIMHATIKDGKLEILDFKKFTGPQGEAVSGIPVPGIMDEVAEIAWSDLEGTEIPNDEWGIDAEAIALDKHGNFWIAEEYRTSVWHIDAKTMKVINRYTPEPRLDIDIAIPESFAYRRPNRGFESITVTPEGWVFAMLQSPMWYPDRSVRDSSRLIRILAIKPETGRMVVYGYETSEASGDVRIRDWKVADITAINDREFLVLEHGSNGDDFFADLYIMSIAQAAPVPDKVRDGRTFEQLLNAENMKGFRIHLTRKTHFLNLFDFGYSREHSKPEGLTIIDAQTIAVITDNDYGADAPEQNENLEATGEKTCLYLIRLPDSLRLNLP